MSKQQNNNQKMSKVKKPRNVPGLLECEFEYEQIIKNTTASFKWTGPKLPREMWREVLAFFKWTYDETKSESQVRLYVNARLGTWKAWAYPQEANLGMTAKELTDPWGPEQFVFSDADGWMLFGTVHHHCSASAFQSGVDAANEVNQPGLHITVGHMGKDQYDIDARLYIDEFKLGALKLSEFWDIGEALSSVPKIFLPMLPNDWAEKMAKAQMGEVPPADTAFPEQWRANIIYKKPEPVKPWVSSTYPSQFNSGGFNNGFRQFYLVRSKVNLPFDLNKCKLEIANWITCENAQLDPVEPKWDWDNVNRVLFDLVGKFSDEELNLLDIIFRNDVSVDKFLEYRERELDEEDAKQEQLELKRLKGTDKRFGGGCGSEALTEADKEQIMQEYYGGHA